MNRDLVLRILDRSHDLISSARIEGAAVHDKGGDRIGTMHSAMIGKRSGKVSYAVMLLDGAETAGRAHPLPWAMLDYDPDLPGYRVDLSPEVLASAPAFALDDHDRPIEVDESALHGFYGTTSGEGSA